MATQEVPPVVYVSYSWSSEEHKRRVLDLATYLRESGVDLRIDRWHLKDGMESTTFMESMVAGKGADRVLIICDKEYANKADNRSGGVGTEAQIITSKIYEQRDEGNYLLLAADYDGEGKPYLPTFYSTRIWRDFGPNSEPGESYPAILRWCFGETELIIPKIGKKPQFLLSGSSVGHVGGPLLMAKQELQKSPQHVRAYLPQVFNYVLEKLLEIGYSFNGEVHDQELIDSLQGLRDLRRSLIFVIERVAMGGERDVLFPAISNFLESVYTLIDEDSLPSQTYRYDADRQKYFINEFILHCVVVLLRHRRYEWAASFIRGPYCVKTYHGALSNVDISQLQSNLGLLEIRNKRLQKQRVSLMADTLLEALEFENISNEELFEADAVAIIGTNAIAWEEHDDFWRPTVSILNPRHFQSRLFTRARTKDGLKDLLTVTGCSDLEELKKAMYRNGALINVGVWSSDSLWRMVNFDSIIKANTSKT